MKIRILLIFFLLILFSCNRSEENQVEESFSEMLPDETIEIIAIEEVEIENSNDEPLFKAALVTVDGLSLRDEPNTECHVLRLLDAGTRLSILDRSNEPDQIGDMTDYWYQVELDSTYTSKGWVYGSYISEYKGPEVIEHTYFTDHELIDHSQFPNSEMKIFGIEPPYEIPNSGERSGYDGLNSTMFVQVDKNQIMQDSAWIEAISPTGDSYRQYQRLVIINAHPWTNEPIDSPFIGFRFFDLSSFPDGTWQFNISTNNDIITSFEQTVKARELTVSKMKTPDPFNNNGSAVFEKYETAYISGNLEAETEYSFVVYQMLNESQGEASSPDYPLIPIIATKMITDEKGQFQLELNLGDDFPQGDFELGVGIEEINITLLNLGFRYDKGEQVYYSSDR